MDDLIMKEIGDRRRAIEALAGMRELIERAGGSAKRALERGGKVLWCGNGGSAAMCQHMAAELVGRFRKERKALASLALTTDSSILTSVANDYGYERVFARQVEGLCGPNDLLVAVSTSGESENVILAIRAAKAAGAEVIGITGPTESSMAPLCDLTLPAPGGSTACVQEMQEAIGHIICMIVEG